MSILSNFFGANKKKVQKSILVSNKDANEELNKYLAEGWRVVATESNGDYAALVVIEKEE